MSRKHKDAEQPDLFSLFDEEGDGDQSGDRADRGPGLSRASDAAIGLDTGAAAGLPGQDRGDAVPPDRRAGGRAGGAGRGGVDERGRSESGLSGQGRQQSPRPSPRPVPCAKRSLQAAVRRMAMPASHLVGGGAAVNGRSKTLHQPYADQWLTSRRLTNTNQLAPGDSTRW